MFITTMTAGTSATESPGILGTQDEERIGEAGKGKDRGDADHGPEAAGQAFRIREAQPWLGAGFMPSRLANGNYHHGERDEGWNDRDPEDTAKNCRK